MRSPQYRLRPYCQIPAKTIPRPSKSGAAPDRRLPVTLSNPTSAHDMRRILLTAAKLLISAGLLYLALRKVDLSDLASRFDIASLGWIVLAIAVIFLQIFAG